MATYIMLTTLTPEGVQTVKNNPQRIREVNREIEQLGATVKQQWSTLGRFDFVNIVEAPDEHTIARSTTSSPRFDGRLTAPAGRRRARSVLTHCPVPPATARTAIRASNGGDRFGARGRSGSDSNRAALDPR
jgi:hypothetical protein